jgi:predicted Fe-Mo cluster-binding NifX family protein
MSDAGTKRIAIAAEVTEDWPAPRLGRALKFALFDVAGADVRGPFYRVRHDDPGTDCDGHAALGRLLRDCSVVITGAAGSRMAKRLQEMGIEVVITPERLPFGQLVRRYFAGTLIRKPINDPPSHLS